MNANIAPRRRWSAFSLRTMFLVVAVVACLASYLAVQYRVVSHRRAMLRSANAWTCTVISAESAQSLGMPCSRCTVPAARSMFGDEGVFQIAIFGDIPDADLEQIAAAFPEAESVGCLHSSRKESKDPNAFSKIHGLRRYLPRTEDLDETDADAR